MKLSAIGQIISLFRQGNAIENPNGAKWFSLACEALAVALVLGTPYAVQRGMLDQSMSIPQALDLAQVVIGAFFGLLGVSRAAVVVSDPARGVPAKRVRDVPAGAARTAEPESSPLDNQFL